MAIENSRRDIGTPVAGPAVPSVLQVERNRALPQLSFRFLLTVVTLGAFTAFTLRLGLTGSHLAIAVMFSLATLAICFTFFAALFLIAWIPAVIGRDQLEDVHVGNPFSLDQLPPQVLPPREPGT